MYFKSVRIRELQESEKSTKACKWHIQEFRWQQKYPGEHSKSIKIEDEIDKSKNVCLVDNDCCLFTYINDDFYEDEEEVSKFNKIFL